MAQQTRRAPGRPKKAQTQEAAPVVVAEAPKPKAKKSVPIKQNIKEDTACVYEAIKHKGVAFMLMTKEVRVYDKDSDSIRIARYCPNENSIWKEEQSAISRVEPITFKNGFLTARADQPNLKKFLDIHPSNIQNGGTHFKKIDTRIDSEKEVEKEFKVFDAISLVKNSDLNELLAVALYFKVNIDRPVSEVKYDLLKIAKKSPGSFIKSFDDPAVKCKATIKQALEYQIIKSSRDAVRWYDSNGLIVSVPHGQDPVDIMSRFCLTEKGSSVYAQIQDELDRIA
jgi:hypothetical protein